MLVNSWLSHRVTDSLDVATGSLSGVYTGDGRFLGMVRYNAEEKCWNPEQIFLRSCGGC